MRSALPKNTANYLSCVPKTQKKEKIWLLNRFTTPRPKINASYRAQVAGSIRCESPNCNNHQYVVGTKKKLFKTTNQGLSVFRQSAKSTSSLSLYNFLQHLLNYLGTIFWNSRNNITTLTYIYRYSAHFPGSCSHMVLQASGENVRNAAQQTSNALIFYCALNSS